MTETADILTVLERLVASDTRNPPRAITADDAVFGFLGERLDGFERSVTDHGDGSLAMLAVRGEPRIVFNFHLDTVPVAEGWSRDPFELEVADGRAFGLGACDTKGALAAMLVAAADTPGDLAVLVTTDEEAGQGEAVLGFLDEAYSFEAAVVAEPTGCTAVHAHRGIVSARALFTGIAGHASADRALTDSANHRAIRWAERCLAHAEAWRALEAEGLSGVPLNIGRIEGGIKPNMIASRCELRIGVRTLPGQSGRELMDRLRAEAAPGHIADFQITFEAPSLPAIPGRGRPHPLIEAGLVEAGSPVDFWSEAALFSAAGLPSLVLGAGDIAQAHTADEWVSLGQLTRLADIYRKLIRHGLG